jgi:hypothetical protein
VGGRGDLLQLLDAEWGVNLDGAQFALSKELPDKEDVCTAFQHQGCAGVAQQMEGAAFAEVGGVDVFADKRDQPVGGERLWRDNRGWLSFLTIGQASGPVSNDFRIDITRRSNAAEHQALQLLHAAMDVLDRHLGAQPNQRHIPAPHLQGCSMNAPRFAKPELPKNSPWAAPPLCVSKCGASTNAV